MNVWETKLDDIYDIRVERTGDYTGTLIVEEAGTKLATADVGLAYGAKFGPDVDDVMQWQQWAAAWVDKTGDVGPLKALQ